jgi:hypothetical protein
MVGRLRMVNRKGFGRKRPWPILRHYPSVLIELLLEITITSVRIADLRAEIGTRDLPNVWHELLVTEQRHSVPLGLLRSEPMSRRRGRRLRV